LKKYFSPKHLILFSSAALLLYFAAFPLLILVTKSFLPEHFGNYKLLISNKTYWISFYNTLLFCTGTTLLTVVIGLPLAWILHKTDISNKGLLKSLCMDKTAKSDLWNFKSALSIPH